MPAAIGTIAALTNGSDPSGTATPDAGSNRKQVLLQFGEVTNDPSPSPTIDSAAPDETKSIFLEIGSGAADLAIYAHIWNEATIAARGGHSIGYSDNQVWGKQSWTTFTVTGADQGETASQTSSTASGTSIDCGPFSPNTDANGIVVATVVANSANRAPMAYETGLTERVSYSVSDYAGGVADGAGGGDLASLVTLGNDGLSSALVGLVLFFAEAGAGGSDDAGEAHHHIGLFL